MDWSSIFGAPISIAGMIGIIVLLQKAGIDIGGIIRSFLSIRDADTAKETDADTRNVLQTMVFQMSELSNHFNHETTAELVTLRDGQNKIVDMIQETNEILRGMKEYGIKCRKD